MENFNHPHHESHREQECDEEPEIDNSTAHWMGRCALVSWIPNDHPDKHVSEHQSKQGGSDSMTRKYRVKKVKAGHTNPKKAVLNSGSSTPTVGGKVTYYVSLDSEQDDDYKSTQSRIAINQKLIKVTKRAGNRHIPLSQASKELQDFQ